MIENKGIDAADPTTTPSQTTEVREHTRGVQEVTIDGLKVRLQANVS